MNTTITRTLTMTPTQWNELYSEIMEVQNLENQMDAIESIPDEEYDPSEHDMAGLQDEQAQIARRVALSVLQYLKQTD